MSPAALLCAAALAAAEAQPPVFSLSLAEAEAAARVHALDVQAAAEESAASRDRAQAAFAALVPRLTLDGYYKYQTEVPHFSPLPGQPAQPFGDHRATSIGPTLSWTLFDEGALSKTWKAQRASARSASEIERLTLTLAALGARLAYVQAQLAREQVRLLADSVGVAAAQHADIMKRLRAGASSRIESLSSHQTELERRKDYLQAQSSLGTSLRQLLQLIGRGEGLDVRRVADARTALPAPEGLPEPTLLLALDDLDSTPPELAAAEGAGPDPGHPSVLAYERQAESASLGAEALRAGEWPKIQLSAAAAYEYPNGPVLQSVYQKTLGLTASVPLFEAGQAARQAREQEHLSAAALRRRDLAQEQLARDWDKGRAALAALRDQQALDAESVREAQELERLVYSSYRAGRSTYLEVQTYALAALRARVQAAQTQAQILIQLATLAQLAGKG